MTYDQKKVDFFFGISDPKYVSRAGDGKLARGLRSTTRRFMSLWSEGWNRTAKADLRLPKGQVSALAREDRSGWQASRERTGINQSFFYVWKNFHLVHSAPLIFQPNDDGRDGPRTGTPCPEKLGPSDNHGRYPFPPIPNLIWLWKYTNTPFVCLRRIISDTADMSRECLETALGITGLAKAVVLLTP